MTRHLESGNTPDVVIPVQEPISSGGITEPLTQQDSAPGITQTLAFNSTRWVTRHLPELHPGTPVANGATKATRQLTLIRGSGKKSPRTIRPPQGRNWVIGSSILAIMLLTTLVAAFAVAPLATGNSFGFNPFQIGVNHVTNNQGNSNPDFIAQKAATATAFVRQDGYDQNGSTNGGPVVTGAGGFIGGHLVADLRRKGFKRLRAADMKPLHDWHQVFPDAENLHLDLKEKAACYRAAKGARYVFNLAADMGGVVRQGNLLTIHGGMPMSLSTATAQTPFQQLILEHALAYAREMDTKPLTAGPDRESVARFVRETYPHVDVVTIEGAMFFSLDAERHWPNFATIVTTDEVDAARPLHLKTRVNGETRQEDSTDRLTWGFAWLINYISTFATLKPGDLIWTGTPTGAGGHHTPPKWLKLGDQVEVEVAEIGVLRNKVVDEA